MIFLPCVTLKCDRWPWKTTGHLFYATSSSVHHFIAIGEFKLEVTVRNQPIWVKICNFLLYDPEIYIYIYLSNTLPEIDPDTAYVVCISISLGFRQKPSDTALFLVIALTTFNCIVSASVTKGALACFVVTVHWWRHRTHYDVTEVYRALRNILTVHLNNGAICADLRGIPKHYEVTAKAGR